ncbi:DUF3106 domain-containing protein [Mitsuaria sp. GD03876]|uniref:DUF3106 domain-containing protein n=1 Tax=Mitsuaria sp. GD03876 TaxID=2975399 RepID=UPI00244932B2|nr:DUF3106 domain-containing protein [Mitsuaria sp. GD03876]MDH0864278.1 DUF3106 domain-containing protein [Mitsuaria sp. GD03876]
MARCLSIAAACGMLVLGSGTALAQADGASAPAGLAASSSVPHASAPARTGALVGGQTWASLSASQKEALAPLSKEWDQLDGARKGKWLEIAARYPTLPAEHQQRLRERMVEWTRMSPAERQRARIGYQHAGELRAPEQESQLRAKWEAYQALPPEKRQRLAERAAEKASAVGHDAPAPVRSTRANAPIQRAPLSATTGPTIVQALPGATTVLLTQRAEPALPGASAAPGRPLRSPRDANLDPNTLLPRRNGASR